MTAPSGSAHNDALRIGVDAIGNAFVNYWIKSYRSQCRMYGHLQQLMLGAGRDIWEQWSARVARGAAIEG